MTTARRRTKGEHDASRLTETAGRRVDLMAARRDGYGERQNGLRARLGARSGSEARLV